jgi:hypothetical protein
VTTRPINFEISIDGDSETARGFLRIAEAEQQAKAQADALKASQLEASRAQQQMQQQLQRGTQALAGFARGAHLVSDALRDTNPQASQLIGHLGELSGLAAQNIQQFGLLGGAITTAFESAIPAITDSINKLVHYRTLIQEFNSAFAEYLPDAGRRNLNALSQGSSSLRDYNNGRLTPEEERIQQQQIREGERRGAEFARLVEARVRNGNRGHGGGNRAEREEAEMIRAMQEFDRSFEEATTAAQERMNEQFRAEQQDKLDLIQRAHDQQIAMQEQLNEIQEQTHRNEMQRLQQQQRAREQQLQEFQSFAQPIVGGFVGAMSKVIAGTESAGDAFKGLLSGFLEMISQQAVIKAAFEFAEAIAAFASLNVPSGVAHTAAGVAFAGVAVLAGAGAAATAPSGAGTPASPAANQPQQQSGGNTYNINWNSPVVTAQDRAELGRSIGQLAGQSQRRFASSV